MDVVSQMQKQFVDYKQYLYDQGFLDDQFKQLLQLQDESNPDFVFEVVCLFFEDSEKLLNNLATALNYCEEQNRELCEKCLENLKGEYLMVKSKLETLFRMEQQILAARAGGSIRVQ